MFQKSGTSTIIMSLCSNKSAKMAAHSMTDILKITAKCKWQHNLLGFTQKDAVFKKMQ